MAIIASSSFLPNTYVSKEVLRKITKSNTVMDMKNPKKKFNENDTSIILTMGKVAENRQLSLRKHARKFGIIKSLLQNLL